MVSVKHMNIAVATEQQANDMDPHTVAPPRPRAPSLSPPVDAIQLCGREGVRERVYTLGLLSTTFVFDLVSVHCLSRDSADLCVTLTQGALIHA